MNKQEAVNILIQLEREKEMLTKCYTVQSAKEDQDKHNQLIGFIKGIDTAIRVIREEAGISIEDYVELVILRGVDTGA